MRLVFLNSLIIASNTWLSKHITDLWLDLPSKKVALYTDINAIVCNYTYTVVLLLSEYWSLFLDLHGLHPF
jgi:hypothetical protein